MISENELKEEKRKAKQLQKQLQLINAICHNIKETVKVIHLVDEEISRIKKIYNGIQTADTNIHCRR